jgi:RNA polymerase sigma-70 factor (ECF subfamily)
MTTNSGPSTAEARLLDQARAGDRVAFATLVRDASPSLERLAVRMLGHRHDAEDATQEAVMYAWRRLDTFRGEARFGTWLHRILVSRSLDALRSRKRKQTAELPAAIASAAVDPADSVAHADLEDAVRAAIDSLPPVQRVTLLLRVDHGLTYDEIAYVLGSSRNAVRVNLIAGRKRLAVTLRGVVDLGGGREAAS